MTKEELIRNLKYTMEKHKNDKVDTFGTNISLICKDVLDYLEKPTSDDCVSRKRIKEIVSNITAEYDTETIHIDRLMDEIDDMPPVTPTQSWIPVSERLPEPFSFVNCTCHSLIDDREDWVVETFYLPQPPNSPYSDWGNIPMLNVRECEVIAWMHRNIPEPYKAESEEDGCISYRNYIINQLNKLEQIENIVDAYTTDNPREPMYDTEDYINSIREVLNG